jgi:hypothetical protein
MPDQQFSVRVDQDELAERDLAAGLARPSVTGASDDHPAATGLAATHHGARDGRQAARQRSERDHAGRAAGAVGGRAYVFRRS